MLMQMSVCLGVGTKGARQGWVRIFHTGMGNELPSSDMKATHVNGLSMQKTFITVNDLCQMGVCLVSATPSGPSHPLRMEALNPPIALSNHVIDFIYFGQFSDASAIPQPYHAPVFDNICGSGKLNYNAEFGTMFHSKQCTGFCVTTESSTYFGTVHDMYTLAGTATFRWTKNVGGSMTFKGVKDPGFLNRMVAALAPTGSWDRTLANGLLYVHLAVVTMRLGRSIWAYDGCLFEEYLCAVLPAGTVVPTVLVDQDISGTVCTRAKMQFCTYFIPISGGHLKILKWRGLYEFVGATHGAEESNITATISVTIRYVRLGQLRLRNLPQ